MGGCYCSGWVDAEVILASGLIDTTKLKLEDDGTLTGIDDVISQLQTSKSHLFVSSSSSVPGGTGKDGGDEFAGVTTREEFLKLDANQQYAFKQANPTLFKQFLQS